MSLINKLFRKKDNYPIPHKDDKSTISQQTNVNEVDVNKPVENPRLKSLFKQWREQQMEDLLNQVFEEIVIRAHFLSVIMFSEEPEPSDDGTVILKQDTIMQFPMLTTQDGKSIYAAFTDWEELNKWQGITLPPKTLILSFDDYAAMVLQNEEPDGVVINPFGDNFFLDKSLLNHLKKQKDLKTKGMSQQPITNGTEALIGEPNKYPRAMVASISKYLKKQPKVRQAWLLLMIRDNEQSYLLVVDFSGDKDMLFGGIADAARPYLKKMCIDLIPYQDSFGRDAVENVSPFYERK